ncbi:filamentous hemagglutinin N-terminal domain-containing protein [Oscillatoria sp. FACHB-1407]|uniref:two-partner secretion domain-containing protein n=1 Tax=Oscillatoria sp. FACHB-1407 TaxID=2692847 RepID=UPI00168628F8|nr:filamentous hemagglutinin N-terminal domain-containing protein [Oscillatoria sp. FACHB-1407]MBD2461532.1 filamentous hemagglutinin N-terminal domain-containing protein [Oscillatoria sp. FACHB-1407]
MQKLPHHHSAGIALAIATVAIWANLVEGAIAQIRPDDTLGNERSVVTPNVLSERGLIDQINGGAIRNNALFHSFSDFNVNQGQRVYFANPSSIDNIIGRVTGRNHSDINGTLGVLGSANLFLINPNGIVFGANAQLDVGGAFFASTSNSLLLGNGLEYSATDPQAPPLVVVNIQPGLQYGDVPAGSAIASQGNLQTGGDLTLVADTLNLAGQLRAGSDLSLIALNTLTVRDRTTLPFRAIAGGQLLLQGNQAIDISALANADSGLVSGGNLTLQSNGTVIGDTHYSVGGNFSVQTLNGRLGSLRSVGDPVFEVAGDFSLDNYTGASLQILAGGSVVVPGTITITGAGGPFNDGTVTLSNGTSLTLRGTTQPTLDIRAGTTQFFGTPASGATPTRADIRIGSIINSGGLVYLTNQFQPNPDLAGNIRVGSIDTTALTGGGSVVIDSRGRLVFSAIDVSGGEIGDPANPLEPADDDLQGNAGDVTLLADRDIFMPLRSTIFSFGLRGGAITLSSDTAIAQGTAPFGISPLELGWIESQTLGSEQGGDVSLSAPNISIEGNVLVSTYGSAASGNLRLTAETLTTNQSTITTSTGGSGNANDTILNVETASLNFTFLGSFSASGEGGRGGDVLIQANSISGTTGTQISSSAFGIGDAGNITVTAEEITLSGFQPLDLVGGAFVPSSIFSTAQPGAEGNSGNVTVTTDRLTLQNGAIVGTSSFAVGNAGRINVTASESISIDGAALLEFDGTRDTQPSGITSELGQGAVGQGGAISITTPILRVTNGGTITSSSDGDGNAGSVTINATESASFDGVATFASFPDGDRISRAAVFVGENATGNGGTLTITTPNLSLTNGAQLTAETRGVGNAGNIQLNISDSLLLDGRNTGIFANTTATATGNSGSITIQNPNQVTIRDRARIAVDSQGSGTGGNINIQADSLVLDNRALLTAETASNRGGDIVLQIGDVIVLRQGSRISTTAGTARAGGDGGNIIIDTPFLVGAPTENNDITANAFTGRGGRVLITTQGIFGFTPRSRAELEALLGTSDPTQLDPAALATSDITAISQANPNLNGEIIIRTPDTDPLRGVTNLPSDIVDASRLIAQGCSAGGAVASNQGSLVVTGRGGLPPSPTEHLRTDAYVIGWETVTPSTQTPDQTASGSDATTSQRTRPSQITEAQAFGRDAEGRMSLVAQVPGAAIQDFNTSPAVCSPTTLPSP